MDSLNQIRRLAQRNIEQRNPAISTTGAVSGTVSTGVVAAPVQSTLSDDEQMVENIERYYTSNGRAVETINRIDEAEKEQIIADVRNFTREDKSSISSKAMKKRKEAMGIKSATSISAGDAFENVGRLDLKGDAFTTVKAFGGAQNIFKDITSADDYALKFKDGVTEDEKNSFRDGIIAAIDEFEFTALGYSDDNAFVSSYRDYKAKTELKKFYAKYFHDNQAEFAAYATAHNIDKDKFVDGITKKFKELDKESKYVDLKMNLIKNPYYSLLAKDDLKRLDEEELRVKARYMSSKNKTALADYINTLADIKALGLEHEKGTTDRQVKNTRILGTRFKVTDTTTERVHEHDITFSGDAGLSTKDISEKEWLSRNYTNEEKKEDEKVPLGQELLDSVGLSVGYGYNYSRKKRKISAKSKHANLSAEYAKHNFDTSGSISATLFDKGKLEPQFAANIGAGYSYLDVNAGASMGTETKILGNKLLEAKAKAAASIGKIAGKAKFALGKYKDKDGKEKTGVNTTLKAGAYLASGKLAASASLAGLELGAKVQGSVGVGATFKFKHEKGKIKFTFGVTLGLGGNVSVSLDYSKIMEGLFNKGKEYYFKKSGSGKHKEN